jgi:2-C-methyl-D-erythritol 2,4-cyclodiphosphate synthase
VSVRIGNGLDVHAFAEAGDDRPLVLAGVTVPDATGLVGHSDGDVAAHAVADALLGALALGDLGTWFGVDRPQVAGADSLDLLAVAVDRIAAEGWRLGNLDLTIVAQRPRLASYRDAMRNRLATTLGSDVGRVSVTFTTTDRLGAIGRGEGMAAWATVLLEHCP